jgi:hypothetical protein
MISAASKRERKIIDAPASSTELEALDRCGVGVLLGLEGGDGGLSGQSPEPASSCLGGTGVGCRGGSVGEPGGVDGRESRHRPGIEGLPGRVER